MKETFDELPLLIYDNECQLCVRFINSIDLIANSSILNKVPLQNDGLYKKFSFLSKKKCQEDIHFIDTNEKVFIGEEAIEQVLKLIPAAKPFSWLIESNMGQRALDYFHSMASKYRKNLKAGCHDCGTKKKKPDIGV